MSWKTRRGGTGADHGCELWESNHPTARDWVVCWPPAWYSWLPGQAWPSTPGLIRRWRQHPRGASPLNLHPQRMVAHPLMLLSTSDLPGAHWMKCWKPLETGQWNPLGLLEPERPGQVAAEGATLFTKERWDRSEAVLICPQWTHESYSNTAQRVWYPNTGNKYQVQPQIMTATKRTRTERHL